MPYREIALLFRSAFCAERGLPCAAKWQSSSIDQLQATEQKSTFPLVTMMRASCYLFLYAWLISDDGSASRCSEPDDFQVNSGHLLFGDSECSDTSSRGPIDEDHNALAESLEREMVETIR